MGEMVMNSISKDSKQMAEQLATLVVFSGSLSKENFTDMLERALDIQYRAGKIDGKKEFLYLMENGNRPIVPALEGNLGG